MSQYEAKKALKAEFSGNLEIGDLTIECSVLEGGIRVLSYRGMGRALGGSESWSKDGASNLPPFLDKKSIKPFVSAKISAPLSEPIVYKPLHGGRTAFGVPAELLPDICDVWLKAREEGKLNRRDLAIAAKAEILMRGLAHIGIIALVDEATGYQETRDKAELRLILKKYINDALLPWTLRFPHEFYQEMFRLKGWEYNASSKRKKPMMAGKLTKELIYDKLPDGVIDEIKRINPKRLTGAGKGLHEKHHHRFLTKDVGNPHLDKLIASVTMLMKISPNWRKFEGHYHRAFGGQQVLDLEGEE